MCVRSNLSYYAIIQNSIFCSAISSIATNGVKFGDAGEAAASVAVAYRRSSGDGGMAAQRRANGNAGD